MVGNQYGIGEERRVPGGEEFTKVVAIYTGDGWAFAWECDNDCGDEESINDWFPFLFNWCNVNDLEKHGIEVI